MRRRRARSSARTSSSSAATGSSCGRTARWCAELLAVLTLAACGDGAPAIPPEPQDAEPNHGTPGVQDATGGKIDIPIRDGRFTQPRMHVKVGQIVVFTDDDDTPHTVRNVAGGLPHSGLIPVGGRFEYTPLRPGVVRYHCVVHPDMRGVLVVRS